MDKTKKNKQIVRKPIGTDVLKKYRVQKPCPGAWNIKKQCYFWLQKAKNIYITYKLLDKLVKFLEDDRVSRMLPGKKDAIKRGSLKKQRRVLLDTVDNLHKQFQTENNVKISRSSFYRAWPFWVTFPKMSDWETCACIKHSNMEILVRSLKNANEFKERTPQRTVEISYTL